MNSPGAWPLIKSMYMHNSCGGVVKSRLHLFSRFLLTFPYHWDYCGSYYLAVPPPKKKTTNKTKQKKQKTKNNNNNNKQTKKNKNHLITAERKNNLIGSVRTSCINFPVQVVMLVTSVKQADTSPCTSKSTYRQTDLHTFLNIYRGQSLVASLVQQTVLQFYTLRLLSFK